MLDRNCVSARLDINCIGARLDVDCMGARLVGWMWLETRFAY
jgi:hypothetical protein